jgi:hypothetical protein
VTTEYVATGTLGALIKRTPTTSPTRRTVWRNLFFPVSGASIAGLGSGLPDGVLIALVSRGDDSRLPDQEMTLRRGDHLTFVGRRDAVQEAIKYCHPELQT